MRWLLNKLIGWRNAHKPRVICNRAIWVSGVSELANRTLDGQRESGAFLLGKEENGCIYILEFVYYDDIDPHALDSGIVHFHGNCFTRLWEHCRSHGYGVVADVHVHPGGYFQSHSDMNNPVMPRSGHIAIIIPDYAQQATEPGGIGIYEYLGNLRWHNHTTDGSQFFCLKDKS